MRGSTADLTTDVRDSPGRGWVLQWIGGQPSAIAPPRADRRIARVMRRALSVVCAGAALAAPAGCREEDPVLAPACREGPDAVLTALRAAPGEVRLDGDTPLSACLDERRGRRRAGRRGHRLRDRGPAAGRPRRAPTPRARPPCSWATWSARSAAARCPTRGWPTSWCAGSSGEATRADRRSARVPARAAGGTRAPDSLSRHRDPKGTHGRSAAVVGLGDEQGSGQLPRVRRARAGPGGADARARQGRRRPHQRRAGPAGRRRGRAHRRRGRRDRRRRARRPVPDRRLPDRLGHLVEHERQRGHRRAGGRRGARQRPREHGPVLQRRVPVGRAPGRGLRGHREAAARAGEAGAARSPPRPTSGRTWSRPAAPT